MQTLINTRADLDAIAGTPEHVAFMALLAGTLWRLEKDDTAHAWVAIEDNSTIERFDFTRADFPDAQPPALPEYVPEVVAVPEVVTQRQARLALLQMGKLDEAEAALNGITDAALRKAALIEWEFANEIRRDHPLIAQISAALNLTEQQIDQLFMRAKEIR